MIMYIYKKELSAKIVDIPVPTVETELVLQWGMAVFARLVGLASNVTTNVLVIHGARNW